MTAETPLVLCLHGLGGNSHSRNMELFVFSALKRGYRCVVYNRRGHGGVSLLPVAGTESKAQPKIFPRHVNMDDMVNVVTKITSLYPLAPKYLIGFSCGANLAVHYLATAGDANPFIGSASISNGFDIMNGTTILKGKNKTNAGLAAQVMYHKQQVKCGCSLIQECMTCCRSF